MEYQDGKHIQSVDTHQSGCSNYLERHLSNRKKRTFNILKRFDPALASEVVYKAQLEKRRIGMKKIDVKTTKMRNHAATTI